MDTTQVILIMGNNGSIMIDGRFSFANISCPGFWGILVCSSAGVSFVLSGYRYWTSSAPI